MMRRWQSNALKALGRIEGYKNDLKLLDARLAAAPLWLPAAALKKQCDYAVGMIQNIAQRFDRKLVVTIIGPCGSGKSTLLNALAGVDDISEIGHRRPTTEQLIIFGSDRNDADQLAQQFGNSSVQIRSSSAAALLEHVLLIDTPDTDSAANKQHIPIVQKAISQSDILVCVFDGENPKRRDHIDFLAPYVRLFNGDSVVCVINKSDRLDEQELNDQILADFLNHLKVAWQGMVDRVLCVSARRHLQDPDWDPTASPKHEFDQFSDLQKMVFDTMNQAGYVIDRRVENAKHLRDFVFSELNAEIQMRQPELATAAGQIKEAEKNALLDTITALKDDDSRQFLGINIMVYQKLCQLWVGPMGWMIAIWTRVLIFGTGIVAMFRFGQPLRQALGVFSALRHFKDSKSAMDSHKQEGHLEGALRTYRLATLKYWPDIAESLIKGGFDSDVRKIDDSVAGGDLFSEQLTSFWIESVQSEISRVSRRLSGFLMQFIFNIPGVGILGYTGWVTLKSFFLGSYLSVDFFLHALWAIVIIFLLSFFLLQTGIRLTAGADRLTGRAFEKMKNRVDQISPLANTPLGLQLEIVGGLADLSNPSQE
jgi:GTPase SAR1 family protein